MNVYIHAPSAVRPSLRLAVQVAIVAALVGLAGWAVRVNMVSRESHGKGGGNCGSSATSGGLNSGDATLSPAADYRDYFRFDPGNPGLGLANTISVSFQFGAVSPLNYGGLEFPGLPDSLPGNASEGWLNADITSWNAPADPLRPRTASFLTTALGDESYSQVLSLGTRTRVGSGVSFLGPTSSDQVYHEPNGVVMWGMRGADPKGPLQTAPHESATGFLMPASAMEAHPIPEPAPATLAAAGFLVMLFRFNARWRTRR